MAPMTPTDAPRSFRERLAGASGTVIGQSAAMFVAMVTSVVSGPVLARAVGADGRGLLAVTTTITSLLVLLLGAGFPVAARRFSAKGADLAAGLMALGFRLALLALPAALLAGILFTASTARIGESSQRLMVVLVIGAAPLGIIKNFGAGCLTGRADVASLTTLRAVPSIALSVAYVLLAILGKLTVTTALIALLLTALLEAWLATRPLDVAWGAPERLRTYWRFSLKSLPGQLAETSSMRVDQAILFALLPTAALGRYAVAVSTASMPLLVLAALQARDFARVAGSAGDSATREAGSFILRGFVITALFSLLMAIVSPPLISIVYGPDFRGLGVLVVLLFAGTVMLSLSVGGGAALVALGRPGASTAGWVVAVATTVVLVFPFARAFGIQGAGWVSVISYSAAAGVHLALLRRAGVRVFSRESADGLRLVGPAKRSAKN